MKLTLGVIFGGNSTEYEVSLVSASSVLRNVDLDRFNVVMIGITRQGEWYEYFGKIDDIESGEWVNSPDKKRAFISPDPTIHGLIDQNGNTTYLDVVFPVLHGKNGEDGTMQGLLELSGIPFVGCNTLTSAICMDKDLTHIVLTHHQIPNARWISIRKTVSYEDLTKAFDYAERYLGYPMFVKPANAGSSVGIRKAKNRDELVDAVFYAHTFDDKVVVEEFIKGIEVECAVMGNENPIASVLGEICPCNEFYDYDAKYQSASETYIPARISEETTQLVKETAVKAYKALGCRGLTRVDFFVKPNGSICLIEPNTLPGFTSISMYPKLRMQDGTSYKDVITSLIAYALEKVVE
jgi:D-alanine-D-alanine ligase